MDIKSPSEWGSRVDYDSWTDPQTTKDLIAIHWGGPPPSGYDEGPAREAEILRSYENYHLDSKGWRGIAYGFAVGASGTVYRLRGKNNYGAHPGDYDGDGISNNKEVIPVLFIIGKGQHATPEMWASFINLRWWLIDQSWTTATMDVSWHGALKGTLTECPGEEIIATIKAADWAWKPPVIDNPDPPTTAEWVADMKSRYAFTLSDAVEVAQYQGGSNVAFNMGINGSPLDGWNLLLIMELAERISNE